LVELDLSHNAAPRIRLLASRLVSVVMVPSLAKATENNSLVPFARPERDIVHHQQGLRSSSADLVTIPGTDCDDAGTMPASHQLRGSDISGAPCSA
jgi:hypothetical protein